MHRSRPALEPASRGCLASSVWARPAPKNQDYIGADCESDDEDDEDDHDDDEDIDEGDDDASPK